MFDKVKRLEKKVRDLEKEIQMHEQKRSKAKPEHAFVHGERRRGAQAELQKVNAQLILARAEANTKIKSIQSDINKLQKEKEDLARRWVQSSDSDVKLKLDKQINEINKKLDKLEKKKKK